MNKLFYCLIFISITLSFSCNKEHNDVRNEVLLKEINSSNCSLYAPSSLPCYDIVETVYTYLNGSLNECLADMDLSNPACEDCEYAGSAYVDIPFNISPNGTLDDADYIVAQLLAEIEAYTSALEGSDLCFVESEILEFVANCNSGGVGGIYLRLDYYTCASDDAPCGAEDIEEYEPCFDFLSATLPAYINDELANCYLSRRCPRGMTCERIVRFTPTIYIPVAFDGDGVNAYEMIEAIQQEIESIQGESSFCYLNIVATTKPYNNCFDKGAYIFMNIYYSFCVKKRTTPIDTYSFDTLYFSQTYN